jgi:hypothetical protein
MSEISKYEQHAAECRRMAQRIQDPSHKRMLEDMAHTWDKLARHHERSKQVDDEVAAK